MAFIRITPARFGASELALSPSTTTIRTTPAHAMDMVKSIDISNNSDNTATVSIWLVPSGDSPSNSNILMPGVQLMPHTIFQWTGTQVLAAGATIRGQSSVAGVCVTVSGGEAI